MSQELKLIQEFEENDVWFRENYQNLQKKYSNEHVAIKNGKILDHDKNPKVLMKRIEEKKEDLAIF